MTLAVSPLSDRTFERIAALMHTTVGLSFAASKKSLVSSRLAPRIQRILQGQPQLVMEPGKQGGATQQLIHP